MANERMTSVLSDLRRAVLVQDQFAGDDAQLLEAFFQQGSEIALEVLLRRHGPMVMGVCRRVLHDPHDTEDAFQATFLVLARKGGSLRKMHLVGNWLYGVAYRCALQIRSANRRRRANERQVVDMPETAVDQNHIGNDLRLLLDRELDRLPEKYRVAIVLCDLEGRRRREVARQLGLAEGTLSSRLATGRRLLAKRLSRRGVSLSGGLLAALLTEQAQASVPPALAKATYHAAVKVWAGQALTSLGVSTGVVTTFKGVMQAMLLTKLKLMMACLLAAGIMAGVFGSFVFGGGLADYLGSGSAAAGVEERSREANEPVKDNGFAKHLQSRPWTLKALNVEQRTITICDKPNRSGGLTLVLTNPNAVPKPPDQKGVKLEGLQLAPAAKVFINLRPAKLSDLKDGMTLLLKIAAGKTQIAEIQVISQLREDQYFVEAVDLKKQTITVKFNDSIVKLPLAKDARMIVEMIVPPGKEPQTVASPVTDVARGTPIHLEMVMEADRLAVRVLKVSQ